MKTRFLIFCLCMILILSGCASEEQKQVKAEAQSQAAVLTGGDMKAINAMVFDNGDASDPYGFYQPLAASEEGFLGDLFAMCQITVKKVEEDAVTLRIKAPDLSDFFARKEAELASLETEEELSALLIDYAGKAPTVTTDVTLGYTLEDETIRIDYYDGRFLDAMTGGLVSAYRQLYRQLLDELGG